MKYQVGIGYASTTTIVYEIDCDEQDFDSRLIDLVARGEADGAVEIARDTDLITHTSRLVYETKLDEIGI